LGKDKPDDAYVDEPEKIRVARYWIGEVGFELMESTTTDGDVAKFIGKNGEGVMLISFNVDNTRAAAKELQAKGYQFIPDKRGEIVRPFRDGDSHVFIETPMVYLTELIDDKGQLVPGQSEGLD
jgi:methylmalonyl-CoA/ethylmalonyl-CoA epimerase